MGKNIDSRNIETTNIESVIVNGYECRIGININSDLLLNLFIYLLEKTGGIERLLSFAEVEGSNKFHGFRC